MFDLGADSQVQQRAAAKPRQGAWPIYRRLVGYAWRYKGRLAVSLLFALVIAASFGTMLVGMGTVVKLVFVTPAEGTLDPAQEMAGDLRGYLETMQAWLGWAPQQLDERFLALVEQMRAAPMTALFVACGFVLALALIIGIARFLQEYFAGQIGASISTDLGLAMYENLMRQSLRYFEQRSSGDLLARFTNDIFMVNRGLAGVFVKLMREPIKAVTFLAIALSVDPVLTIAGVGVLPPVVLLLARLGKLVRRSVRRSLQKVASMASLVNETVQGMLIIQSFNMQAYEVSRVRGEIDKLRGFLLRMARLNAATGPLTEFILVIGVVVFVLLSGRQVISGTLDAGDLVTLYVALAMMLDPVRKLSSVNNMIQTSVASAERVFEVIDSEPDFDEAPDAQALPPLHDAIRFEGVSFSYDGKRTVLDGIDLEIRRGEMVALVGFSGAGKSTLVKLVPRFYDVTSGRITLDGIDVRAATLESLRAQIGIVTQDTILFDETVHANIAFGSPDYDAARVRAAAEAANASAFIEALPEGYETRLGEAAGTLSGGQRQRLAIARAIVKDPAILILDEATSSLDSESERAIQAALDAFVAGRTTIVIAHRLSTVQRADRIVVLDAGRVAEQGTHEELLAHGGIYRRLYETQFGPQAQAPVS